MLLASMHILYVCSFSVCTKLLTLQIHKALVRFRICDSKEKHSMQWMLSKVSPPLCKDGQ